MFLNPEGQNINCVIKNNHNLRRCESIIFLIFAEIKGIILSWD